ncbi:MAG: GTP cyclohydrolase, FolE2/MptA family, partial [Candidatus Altarchaeaceae archaeon]
IEKIDRKVKNCEDFCVDIAKEIIKSQKTGNKSYVRLKADFTTERKKFDKKVQKTYELYADAIVTKEKVYKSIGCSAVGLNACPCAQETIKENTIKKLKEEFSDEEIEKIINLIPLVTHNQRVKIKLIVTTEENEHVELEDLIDIVENSFSSEIFEMLKRPEEAKIVEIAHRNPLFVEDSIRRVMKNFYDRYKNLKTAKISTTVESFESIHPHNAIAKTEISIDELRKIFE